MATAGIQRRWRVIGGVLVCTAAAFPLVDRITHHHGETAILLMPPALGAILWWGWPRVRRRSWRGYALYAAVLGTVVAGVHTFVAHIARGRVLPAEILWTVYFCAAWRLAWAVYTRTVGVAGERWRRWGRRARRLAGRLGRIDDRRRRHLARAAMTISPLRFCAVVFLFTPLVVGSLVHRFKLGNPKDLGYYGQLPIEEVTFETTDGLTLSGWFLPESGSEATVLICHGAGANKGNFIDYLCVFHARGYSVLIYDARGHGDSDGHTSTFGLFEPADVWAAVDWLKNERPTQARHVFGLGSSLGAMTLVRAAAEDQRIEAVVLDSCFASAPRLAHQHADCVPVLGPILTDLVLASMSLHAGGSIWQVDARPAIAALAPRPVLLIHGTEDWVIPPDNLELLYETASEPKEQWLGPGPHSNILTEDFDEYQRRVLQFLDTARDSGHN